jgi:hypothetical protein
VSLGGRVFCQIWRKDARSEAVVAFQACRGICSLFYHLVAVESIQASVEDGASGVGCAHGSFE